jgi:hypothetical protein
MAGKRGRALFKETEIARCFRAAKTAGVSVRVDISPNGGLSLIPVESPTQVETVASKTAPALKAWD